MNTTLMSWRVKAYMITPSSSGAAMIRNGKRCGRGGTGGSGALSVAPG
jgi:hypothetical protein